MLGARWCPSIAARPSRLPAGALVAAPGLVAQSLRCPEVHAWCPLVPGPWCPLGALKHVWGLRWYNDFNLVRFQLHADSLG